MVEMFVRTHGAGLFGQPVILDSLPAQLAGFIGKRANGAIIPDIEKEFAALLHYFDVALASADEAMFNWNVTHHEMLAGYRDVVAAGLAEWREGHGDVDLALRLTALLVQRGMKWSAAERVALGMQAHLQRFLRARAELLYTMLSSGADQKLGVGLLGETVH